MHVASIVAFCWFAAQSIAQAIAGASLAELLEPVAATAASILMRALTQAALDAIAARGAAVVKSQLRMRVLAAVDRGGVPALGERSSADVATLVGQGLDAMDGYIGKYLPQLILTAVAMPIVVGVLLFADLATGIAVIVTLPIIPVFMVLIGWATQAVQRRQWQALTTLSRGFLEVVEGLSTLMIFGRQHRQAQRIADVTEQYRERTMRVLRLSFLSSFVLELAASLAVAVVAVSVGVRLIDGALPLALGLFVLVLTPEAYLPLRQVGAQYHVAAEGIAVADEVLELLATPAAVGTTLVDARDDAPVSTLADAAHRDAPADAARAGNPALHLANLTVPRGGAVVVEALDASWGSGRLVAVTGSSGAGKSSLLAAILGLAPSTGSVRIEGVELAPGERAARIAWAGQRPELTSGALDAVVALGAQHPDPVLVARALTLAGALDVSVRTVLGPAGDGLSGGQAQRVAIARAYYRALDRDLPVVLLDEPTSALDAEAEQRVIAGMRAMASTGRLVVVVTHRSAVVDAADDRLVLGVAQAVAAR